MTKWVRNDWQCLSCKQKRAEAASPEDTGEDDDTDDSSGDATGDEDTDETESWPKFN